MGSHDRSTVTRIDPDTRRVVKAVRVSENGLSTGLISVATGAGSVWALNVEAQSITRIDPRANTVVATIHVSGTEPRMLAADGDRVWVTLAAPET